MPQIIESKTLFNRSKTLPDGRVVDVTPKPPQIYLLLLKANDDTTFWETMSGDIMGTRAPEEGSGYYYDCNGVLRSTRTPVFNYLVDLARDNISLTESYIMTQNQTMKTNMCIYSFIRLCLESDKVIAMNADITLEDLDDLVSSELDDDKSPDDIYNEDMNVEVD